MIVPDECVQYIRWQRLAAVRDAQEVKRQYAEWVATDYAEIAPHLPERAERILDIGCGMAGIDVFLIRRYPGAQLFLLDGDGANVTRAGEWNEAGVGKWNTALEPYNSRAHTEMLLSANGVSVDRWHDIGTRDVLAADLIVSLFSCGFHYPLKTYRLSGLCLMDLRRGPEKTRGKVIASGAKHDRCLFRVTR